jgi:RimJ/RimL family protein N-acetyltransferase
LKPILRSFAWGDREGLVTAINTVCSEGRWLSTRQFEPTPAWLHALQTPDCPRHCLLVVEDGGSIVGWCRLFPVSCTEEADEAELGIGLLPSYRDMGLGTELVHQMLDWARKAGLQRVRIVTRADNHRAIHVFTGCGFRPSQVSGTHIEMVCPLNENASKQLA